MGDGLVKSYAVFLNFGHDRRTNADINEMRRAVRSDGYATFMSSSLRSAHRVIQQVGTKVDTNDKLLIYLGGKSGGPCSMNAEEREALIRGLYSLKYGRRLVFTGPGLKTLGGDIRKIVHSMCPRPLVPISMKMRPAVSCKPRIRKGYCKYRLGPWSKGWGVCDTAKTMWYIMGRKANRRVSALARWVLQYRMKNYLSTRVLERATLSAVTRPRWIHKIYSLLIARKAWCEAERVINTALARSFWLEDDRNMLARVVLHNVRALSVPTNVLEKACYAAKGDSNLLAKLVSELVERKAWREMNNVLIFVKRQCSYDTGRAVAAVILRKLTKMVMPVRIIERACYLSREKSNLIKGNFGALLKRKAWYQALRVIRYADEEWYSDDMKALVAAIDGLSSRIQIPATIKNHPVIRRARQEMR